MKKVVALVMALLLGLSLIACGMRSLLRLRRRLMRLLLRRRAAPRLRAA